MASAQPPSPPRGSDLGLQMKIPDYILNMYLSLLKSELALATFQYMYLIFNPTPIQGFRGWGIILDTVVITDREQS